MAEAFNSHGYHGAVLEYQLGQEIHGLGPVQELAWAVRVLRETKEWEGKAEKVWIVGFSAGGHLAASLGVLWNHEEVIPKELQEKSRPDGLILGYPVITMGEYGHPRSILRLTGKSKKLIELFSLENHDLSQVPPVFLWNTLEDEKVPAMNSVFFAKKLVEDGGSCEYHMFHKGLHGMSLATPEDPGGGGALQCVPHFRQPYPERTV